MTAPTTQDTQDARIHTLEERLAAAIETFGGELGELETRMRHVERSAPVLQRRRHPSRDCARQAPGAAAPAARAHRARGGPRHGAPATRWRTALP